MLHESLSSPVMRGPTGGGVFVGVVVAGGVVLVGVALGATVFVAVAVGRTVFVGVAVTGVTGVLVGVGAGTQIPPTQARPGCGQS